MKYFVFLLVFTLSINLQAQRSTTFTDIKTNPSEVRVGDKVSVKSSIFLDRTQKNDVLVLGSIDGKEVFKRSIRVSPKRTNVLLEFSWTPQKFGKHVISLKAVNPTTKQPILLSGKPLEILKEINVLVRFVPLVNQEVQVLDIPQPVCEGTPLPDIVAIAPGEGSYEPPGAMKTVFIGIKNTGQCETGPFNVRVKVRKQIGNEEIESDWKIFNLPSLPPDRGHGEGATSIEYTFRLDERDNVVYDFNIEADYDHNVNEWLENNNDLFRVGFFVIKVYD